MRTWAGRAKAAGRIFAKRNPVRNGNDELIDQLIRPPVTKYPAGSFDWSKTEKLAPTGAASRDKVLSGRLQPAKDL